MTIQFLYPYGKTKALTFSYDDGQQYDRQLVELFNRYQVKGTFHLNSGIIDSEGFITSEEVQTLYKGHEVACHGVVHHYLNQLTKEQLVHEIWEDRRQLEAWTGQFVTGMSYPFGEYSEEVIQTLVSLGIQYSRTIECTQGYRVPEDFMKWQPTCHHNEGIIKRADDFLNTPSFIKLPLFYIWGHSFEFARESNWNVMEEFLKKIAFREEIWYATNLEIRDYITAIRNVKFSVDQHRCYNPSGIYIWLRKNEEVIELKPGESINI